MQTINLLTGAAANGVTGPVHKITTKGVVTYSSQAAGTFSATVLLEGSLDGTSYFTLQSHTNTTVAHTVDKPVKYMRARVSAYVSGTIDLNVTY